MGRINGVHLLVLVILGLVLRCWCQDGEDSAVYIVTLKQPPVAHYLAEAGKKNSESLNGDTERLDIHKPRSVNISRMDPKYESYIARVHDSLLRRTLRGEKFLKLYSYHYLINGFAVLVTPDQVNRLSRRREVANVVLDFSVRTATTHTPQFLGLPQGAWVQGGGFRSAGEGVVIGFIDTGIDPTHISFADDRKHPYPVPDHFSGVCVVTRDFPSGSCNRKLIAARHFAASAITRGVFNISQDYASPFDGDGHGTHTASIAAGNHGIPVVVAAHQFGHASGTAPRAQYLLLLNRRGIINSGMKLSYINTKTNANGAAAPASDDNECMVREQDRFMPIANVIRIMRKILPPHAKISDDAKETIQECVSEYISFITGEANERCQREQRKTITAEDVLWAMNKLGFDDYIEPLTVYLHRFREMEGDNRGGGSMMMKGGNCARVMSVAEYHAAAVAGPYGGGGFAPFHHHGGFYGYLKDVINGGGAGTSTLAHQGNDDHMHASHSHQQFNDDGK